LENEKRGRTHLLRVARTGDEAAPVVQDSAEDPGKAVQEAEAGKGTGSSQTSETAASQETVLHAEEAKNFVIPFLVGRCVKGVVQHVGA
jgi:hypothetical protein